MSVPYAWTCKFCGDANVPLTSTCGSCGRPAVASPAEGDRALGKVVETPKSAERREFETLQRRLKLIVTALWVVSTIGGVIAFFAWTSSALILGGSLLVLAGLLAWTIQKLHSKPEASGHDV